MVRALLIVLALAGCKKSEESKPWIPDPNAPPVVADSELKRGKDACTTYVTKVCDCAKTKPDLEKTCALAKGYPEAIEAALYVAGAADSPKRDVVSTNNAVRKIFATCIEQATKLPAGC